MLNNPPMTTPCPLFTCTTLAIARTLAADPDIVLYDEPTSGLDAASGRKVADLIRTTHEAHQRTSIVVTHDYETLIPIADEVLQSR